MYSLGCFQTAKALLIFSWGRSPKPPLEMTSCPGESRSSSAWAATGVYTEVWWMDLSSLSPEPGYVALSLFWAKTQQRSSLCTREILLPGLSSRNCFTLCGCAYAVWKDTDWGRRHEGRWLQIKNLYCILEASLKKKKEFPCTESIQVPTSLGLSPKNDEHYKTSTLR